MPGDELSIDTKDLVVLLPPDTAGLLEPVSGIMFLNVEDQEFEQMRHAIRSNREEEAEDLLDVFHHEMYHAFQTYSNGYQYDRVLRFWNLFSEHSFSMSDPAMRGLFFGLVRDFTASYLQFWQSSGQKSQTFRSRVNRRRIDLLFELAKRRRESGDGSLAGTMAPKLFEETNKIHQVYSAPGNDGFSAEDVVEGSAVAYATLATRTAEDARSEFNRRAGQDEADSVALFDAVRKTGTERPFEVLLAAAALALRYEHPENAFVPIVHEIVSAGPGEERNAAHAIEAAMPLLPGAGNVLGTAADVHYRRKASYTMYQEQLEALKTRAWGIDELDLLCGMGGLDHIPPGKLGFGIVTRSAKRGFRDTAGMGVRLIIAMMMLRARSLDRFALDVGREFRDLVLGASFPEPPASGSA